MCEEAPWAGERTPGKEQAELSLELAQVGSKLFLPVGIETPSKIWKITVELQKNSASVGHSNWL